MSIFKKLLRILVLSTKSTFLGFALLILYSLIFVDVFEGGRFGHPVLLIAAIFSFGIIIPMVMLCNFFGALLMLRYGQSFLKSSFKTKFHGLFAGYWYASIVTLAANFLYDAFWFPGYDFLEVLELLMNLSIVLAIVGYFHLKWCYEFDQKYIPTDKLDTSVQKGPWG